jgi:hypothetical protein
MKKVAITLLAVAGCIDNGTEGVACSEQGSIVWSNGLNWSNGINWSNGVSWSNGVQWSNGVIWSNGLGSDPDLDFSCRADDLRLFEYTVGCALRAGQHVEVRVGGDLRTVEGRLALAPEWFDGPCGESCRGWVSACLIASLNGMGERVEIGVSGEHPALGTDPVPGFAKPEATFYGNLFDNPMQLHACLAPGVSALDRSCAGRSDCPIVVAGTCRDVCDGHTCRDVDGNTYEATITTTLRSESIRVPDAAARVIR